MASAEQQPSSLLKIMNTMEYGEATESTAGVQEWLSRHGKAFGPFIDGKWRSRDDGAGRLQLDVLDPCSNEKLATVDQADPRDLDEAIAAANDAFSEWSRRTPSAKARHLYSIARHLQKHQQLFTVLESLNTGRAVHEVKNHDVPQVIRCVYHYVGWADLMATEMHGWKPQGVVAIVASWNFPLWSMISLVAPAIAAGNTVVVKPASATPLSALLFAEICKEAGLPPGVFNVVNGPGPVVGKALCSHAGVAQIAFIGSVQVGRELRELTARSGKKLSVHLSGKSAMIVFDSADLDAAVEGVVEGMFFNHGQVASAASRLLIHEPVFEAFIKKLKLRMKKIRIGKSMDKNADLGTVISDKQSEKIKKYVAEAAKEKAEVFQTNDLHTPLTLITNINSASKVAMEEVFGAVVVAFPFRTAKEAVALANGSPFGLAASVWSENMALGLEVAKSLAAANVWINCHNVFDASAEFDRFRLSGFGCCGGKEGLYDFLQPCDAENKTDGAVEETSLSGDAARIDASAASATCDKAREVHSVANLRIDVTYKSYIGGVQKRPDGNSSRTVCAQSGDVLGHVAECGKKDVRDAVEAARKAQSGWAKRTGHNRLQILYYLAENLQRRQAEFAEQLVASIGCGKDEATRVIDRALDSLFCWGSYCDKYGGEVRETTMYGVVYNTREPVGVIGIICPENSSFLPFITLMAAAIARGNTVVIVPSEKYPLACVNFYQVLDTSDVAAGVVNILTGDSHNLAQHLASHQDVDAVWCFGPAETRRSVESLSAGNMKRTWVADPQKTFQSGSAAVRNKQLLLHATKVKTYWMPMGDFFAN